MYASDGHKNRKVKKNEKRRKKVLTNPARSGSISKHFSEGQQVPSERLIELQVLTDERA